MNKTAVVLAGFLLVGCGGALPGEDAPDPIVGAWQTSDTCSVTFDFRADHAFGEATACPLDGGGIGLQVEAGTYTDEGILLELTTLDATCPGWSKEASSTYQVQPGRLQVSDASAVIVLTPATTAPAVGTLGCFFDRNGASMPFQPSPLAPL